MQLWKVSFLSLKEQWTCQCEFLNSGRSADAIEKILTETLQELEIKKPACLFLDDFDVILPQVDQEQRQLAMEKVVAGNNQLIWEARLPHSTHSSNSTLILNGSSSQHNLLSGILQCSARSCEQLTWVWYLSPSGCLLLMTGSWSRWCEQDQLFREKLSLDNLQRYVQQIMDLY